jgi:hypothetical protein
MVGSRDMSEATFHPAPRRPLRLLFWLLGLGATAAWTLLLMRLTALPVPAELVLGAMGLVGVFWGDAVLFPKPRDPGLPSAPGRLPREQALAEAGSWARERHATPAPRPTRPPARR